ncbi:MAG: phosphomannomutase/phosphoglucomutase [Planctomycetes bacterium]|nr:phosphomannomutase/phosphoglucomutase [Planctomycetota bacterium]
MSIFKAYDIRGKVPAELDPPLAKRIGYHFARLLNANKLVVGRDMRTHSPQIQAAVIEGIRDAGSDVLDIGLASTPMAYFAVGSQPCDGGLVVTASHNPGEYNGMKLCRAGAAPVSGATGIGELEQRCKQELPRTAGTRGALERLDLLDAYAAHVARFARIEQPLEVAIDASNGMAGHTLPPILARLEPLRVATIFMTPDGTFPNHEANPLKEHNLDPVRALVKRSGARFGVSFDGDADRCCFVDETGRTVPNDLMTALLAREQLARHPGARIVYDLRSSWVVREEIRKAGGKPLRDRVGHSFIKATMRAHKAVFGGELSGHFYFADNYTCDSGEIAFVTAASLVSRSERPLSQQVASLRRYHSSGEINFEVADKNALLAQLRTRYRDGRQDELDGITVEYGDLGDAPWWWFNVRASNTEPLLRLNLEASDAALAQAKLSELIGLLGKPLAD